jgi:hypothetical protein
MNRRARRGNDLRTVPPGEAPPPLHTLTDCVAWASWLATAAAEGRVDPKTAREIGNAIKEFRNSFEKAHLETRVKELETQLREARKDRR